MVLTGKIPESAPAVARRTPRNDEDYAARTRGGEYTVGRGNPDDYYYRRADRTPAYADENDDDDDVTASVPAPRTRQLQQGYWREYRDGPRYYYYRVRPYQPYQPQRRYGGFLSDW